LFFSGVLVIEWDHLNPIFEAVSREIVLKLSMLAHQLANIRTKPVNDFSVIFLPHLGEELLVKQ
jgi:hypothetical protein